MIIAICFSNRYHTMNIVAFMSHNLYGLCFKCSFQRLKIQKLISNVDTKCKSRHFMKSIAFLKSECNEPTTNYIDEWDMNNYGKVLQHLLIQYAVIYAYAEIYA